MPWTERFVSASMLSVVLGGCATGWFHVGNDFDVDAFAGHAERGVTTRDQVRAWLGAPTSTGVDVDTNGQRYDEWTYYFAEGRVSSLSDAKLKTLQIKFDSKGIVQGWELSQPPK
jgi:outer membrane protein assembly factor BamE (lipoprotein component of BamABCDE complex)